MTTASVPYPGWPRRATAEPERGMARESVEGRVAFTSLLMFTFVLLVSPQTWVPVLGVVRPALLATLVAAGAYVIPRLGRGLPLIVMTPEAKLGLALALWALVTVPFSRWPGGSMETLFGILGKSLVVCWLVSATVNTPRRFRVIVSGLVLMTLPAAVSGILNWVRGVRFQDADRIMGYSAPLSGNPNDLALLLNLMLPFAVAMFQICRGRGLKRAAVGGAIVLMVTGIVVTFSRAGFLTLVAVFLAYLWKFGRGRERGLVWAAVVLAVVALPLAPAGYFDRVSTIGSVESDTTGSSEERWENMRVAFGYLLTHPLIGTGLGQNVLMLNDLSSSKWRMVHNMYLEYGVELGVLGLGIFVALLVLAHRNAARAAQRFQADRQLFLLAQALHIALIAFAVAAMFHPGGYQFPFFYLVGLSIAVRQIALQRPATEPVGAS